MEVICNCWHLFSSNLLLMASFRTLQIRKDERAEMTLQTTSSKPERAVTSSDVAVHIRMAPSFRPLAPSLWPAVKSLHYGGSKLQTTSSKPVTSSEVAALWWLQASDHHLQAWTSCDQQWSRCIMVAPSFRPPAPSLNELWPAVESLHYGGSKLQTTSSKR
jgi:hypothetical protein